MFSSWVMVLKLSKKVNFLQFCADRSKKSKSIKAICIYASTRSHNVLSENRSRRILLNFCWVSIFFDISIANISWAVAQTPINYIIFWKIVMRTFRIININCFNRLRFLAEVNIKLQKMHFLDSLRAITHEANIETRQMTAFFHLLFPLWLFVTLIFAY